MSLSHQCGNSELLQGRLQAVDNRANDAILQDGLEALFALYRKYAVPTSFSEIHEIHEDTAILQEQLDGLGEMQSIYTELTTEKLIGMIAEAVKGIKKTGESNSWTDLILFAI